MEVAVRKVYAGTLEQQQIEVRQSVMDGLKQAREGKTSTQFVIDWRKSIQVQKYKIDISDLAEQDFTLLVDSRAWLCRTVGMEG